MIITNKTEQPRYYSGVCVLPGETRIIGSAEGARIVLEPLPGGDAVDPAEAQADIVEQILNATVENAKRHLPALPTEALEAISAREKRSTLRAAIDDELAQRA